MRRQQIHKIHSFLNTDKFYADPRAIYQLPQQWFWDGLPSPCFEINGAGGHYLELISQGYGEAEYEINSAATLTLFFLFFITVKGGSSAYEHIWDKVWPHWGARGCIWQTEPLVITDLWKNHRLAISYIPWSKLRSVFSKKINSLLAAWF